MKSNRIAAYTSWKQTNGQNNSRYGEYWQGRIATKV